MLRSLRLVTGSERKHTSAGFPKCTTYQTRLSRWAKGPIQNQGLCSALSPGPILSGCAIQDGGVRYQELHHGEQI